MSFLKKIFSSSKNQKHGQSEPKHSIDIGTIDLKKVYPRIKGLYDDENPEPITNENKTSITASISESPVFKPYAKGLGIFYVIDKSDSFQLIQNKHLTEEITIDKLHDAALTNLAIAISDKTEVNGDPDNVMMVTNGGNFEATMLLADFLWEQIEPVFNDNIVVAIPANDLLFITGKNNIEGRENLRQAIKHYFDERETQGLIVRHIYERANNNWTFVETA